MEDEVGLYGFGESGFKGLDKVRREILNKTDRVGDENFLMFLWQINFADAGVESGEKFVGNINFFAREGV